MIASPAWLPRPVPAASTANAIRFARVAARVFAAAILAVLIGLFLADILAALHGQQSFVGVPTGGGTRLLLACPAVLLALDALVLARLDRVARSRRADARGWAVRYVGSDAAELVARGRVTLANDGPSIAGYLFDRAIAADPYCEEAWLFKAACHDSKADRLACLEAGRALIPTSATLKEALAYANRSGRGPGVTPAPRPAFLQANEWVSGMYAHSALPTGAR